MFEKKIQETILEVLHGVADSVDVVVDASACRVDVVTKFVPAPSPESKSTLYVYLVSKEVAA